MKIVFHSSHPAGTLAAYWESRRLVQMAGLAGWSVEWRPASNGAIRTWQAAPAPDALHVEAPPTWDPPLLWEAITRHGGTLRAPYLTPRRKGEASLASLIFLSEKPAHRWWWTPDRPWELPEETMGRRLREKGWTLATAESCTGGLLAHRITAIPGSSDYFHGSVVAYANTVKEKVLGVGHDILRTHGAVSEPTARAMVNGVVRHLGTNAGLSTTGIAGPTGGTPQKPVGTVWIGLHTPQHPTHAHCFHGTGSRHDIMEQASTAALFLLLQALTPEPS